MEQEDLERRNLNREVGSRMSALEANYLRLHEEGAQLREGLHSVATEMREGFRKLSENNKTDWSSYASWAAVVIALISLGGSGFIRDIGRLEEGYMITQERLFEHLQTGGHKAMEWRVAEMEKKHDHLDEVLQREMRILDDGMKGEIEGLDVRLQNEMRLLNSTQDQRLTTTDKLVTRILDWQEKHDNRVMGLNAEQTARIEAIERKVFQGKN